jgi:hypothetical protein
MSAIEAIKKKLDKYPNIIPQFGAGSILIPAQTNDGFSVSLYERKRSYTVAFEGWHEKFRDETEALKCFAFGLSNECRLRVLRRGNMDYRWFLQTCTDGNWQDYDQVGLFFYPFWCAQHERFLQNHIIQSS